MESSKSTEAATPVEPPEPEVLGRLAASSNAFAVDLWNQLRLREGNLTVSPASISLALAMAWGGARGETAAEMKQVLHFEGSADEVMASAGQLLRSWNTSDGFAMLRVANRLFGERSYAFEQPYLEQTRAAFGAPLEPMDFGAGVETSRQHINDWVARQTQERIKGLLPPGSLKPGLTRLVLVNAIYFKALWAYPFQGSNTRPGRFFATRTRIQEVPLMQRMGNYRFAELDGVKVLEVLYNGEDASMILVLPDEIDGLAAVEQRLTSARFSSWIDALSRERVDVVLPRFEISPEGGMELGEILSGMGMQKAFDPGRADFTGMANPRNPEERLHISDVFHKAFIKLDEEGTEAAAATAVVMAARSALRPNAPKEFRADHPFLFFLRDTRSGMVLFMGRVADPASK
ncbi:serpin family protein [Hyalangium versicolor]|uniref:serpin family protein n=1 Tax=Hyalangium versicolor TaxID=2861190 RepID=UPI001CCCFBCE|nr:serpin family protein [Hyalangium versicolor]